MISPEGLSVPALLDAAALDNREAAVFPDGRASLTELSALSTSYARALVSLGAGPGDHVGALLPAGLYAGRPVAGMEARVVDPLTGADLPDHTPGEFVFRGVSRFARYYPADRGRARGRVRHRGPAPVAARRSG